MEKSGYSEFDFIIAGDDPLISLIAALEKVSLGKKVLIYPSQMIEPENNKVFNLINKRTEFMNDSISLYVNEKYKLNEKVSDLNNEQLIKLISEKINAFTDDLGNPLCYFYKGREIYSDVKFKEKFNGNQIYWPRETELSIGKKWDFVSKILNRFSLVAKEKENKDVKGFIVAEQVILSSRTHSSFCDDYYLAPLKIADAFYHMEEGKRFGLQHRLADILSAMSINKIEKDKGILSKINSMYGIRNGK